MRPATPSPLDHAGSRFVKGGTNREAPYPADVPGCSDGDIRLDLRCLSCRVETSDGGRREVVDVLPGVWVLQDRNGNPA